MHSLVWNRWRCVTHDCGSYNFNSLIRHEIHSCKILTESTVGIIKPKTFGGFHGDLGRGYLHDFQEELRYKQSQESALKKWKEYRDKHDYWDFKYPRRYDKDIKRIFRHSRKKN